ncbi:MAG: hypothetical protein M9890_02945 [Thermomicrobiales bacterium]|nr:hypothetical protein [Thermomicrobiales bacterium]
MHNLFKVLIGTALGAGVGVAISRVLEQQTGVELEINRADGVATVVGQSEPQPGFADRIKGRLEAARLAGEDAKAAKEAELRGYFREKVNDPAAMTVNPLAPQSR